MSVIPTFYFTTYLLPTVLNYQLTYKGIVTYNYRRHVTSVLIGGKRRIKLLYFLVVKSCNPFWTRRYGTFSFYTQVGDHHFVSIQPKHLCISPRFKTRTSGTTRFKGTSYPRRQFAILHNT